MKLFTLAARSRKVSTMAIALGARLTVVAALALTLGSGQARAAT